MTACRRYHFSWATLALLALAGCSSSQPPEPGRRVEIAAADRDAIAHVGDITVRASAVQTSLLPAGVARAYGIKERRPDTILLLVAVRKGPAATALPATVSATVTDLRGARQDIPMRQVRADSFVDTVGITNTSLPDTLRFDLTVTVEGIPPVRLQLQREFYPQ